MHCALMTLIDQFIHLSNFFFKIIKRKNTLIGLPSNLSTSLKRKESMQIKMTTVSRDKTRNHLRPYKTQNFEFCTKAEKETKRPATDLLQLADHNWLNSISRQRKNGKGYQTECLFQRSLIGERVMLS